MPGPEAQAWHLQGWGGCMLLALDASRRARIGGQMTSGFTMNTGPPVGVCCLFRQANLPAAAGLFAGEFGGPFFRTMLVTVGRHLLG